MRRNGIILTLLVLMLVALLSSGCSENKTEPTVTSPPLSPSAAVAVDLHMQGFEAYEKGNYAAALDLYNQAIAADPGYLRAWMDKGNVLMRLNRSAEAVEAFDVVVTHEDYVPNVWNSRGKALMATGNYSAALASFDRALQQAPEFAEAKENRNLTLQKLK